MSNSEKPKLDAFELSFGQPEVPDPYADGVKPGLPEAVVEASPESAKAETRAKQKASGKKRGRPAKVANVSNEPTTGETRVITIRLPIDDFAELQLLAIEETKKAKRVITVPDLVRADINKRLNKKESV